MDNLKNDRLKKRTIKGQLVCDFVQLPRGRNQNMKSSTKGIMSYSSLTELSNNLALLRDKQNKISPNVHEITKNSSLKQLSRMKSEEKFGNYRKLIESYEKHFKVKREDISQDGANIENGSFVKNKQEMKRDKDRIRVQKEGQFQRDGERMFYERKKGQSRVDQGCADRGDRRDVMVQTMDGQLKNYRSVQKTTEITGNTNDRRKRTDLDLSGRLKQLEGRYVNVQTQYNLALRKSRQQLGVYQRQREYLERLKMEHFQNQRLIQTLFYQVRNSQQTGFLEYQEKRVEEVGVQTGQMWREQVGGWLGAGDREQIMLESRELNQVVERKMTDIRSQSEVMGHPIQLFPCNQLQYGTVDSGWLRSRLFESESGCKQGLSMRGLKRDLFNVKSRQ